MNPLLFVREPHTAILERDFMKSILLVLLSFLPLGAFANSRKSTESAATVNPLNQEAASQLGLDPLLMDAIDSVRGMDKMILSLPDSNSFYINIDAQELENSERLKALVEELKLQLGEDTEIQLLRHDEVKLGTQDFIPTM